MAAAPLFLTEGEEVTAKAPATTTDAAEGDVCATEGGFVTEMSDARTEETARTTR